MSISGLSKVNMQCRDTTTHEGTLLLIKCSLKGNQGISGYYTVRHGYNEVLMPAPAWRMIGRRFQ